MKLYKQIPNLLTLCNLLLGCIGIICAFDERYFVMGRNSVEGIHPTFELLATGGGFGAAVISSRLFLSGLCIFIAAVVDFFDGFVARALNAKSEMGKQLDSLADLVTFGVLPGIIYYQLLSRAYFNDTNALFTSRIWLLPALLIPISACWRLAKFNIDKRQTTSFIGLPSPANAIFAGSLTLLYLTNPFGIEDWLINKYVLYSFIVVFAYLMVAEIPMFSLKVKSLKWKGNETTFMFLAMSFLILIFLMMYIGLPYWYVWLGVWLSTTILLYILISIIKSFIPQPANNEV